MATENSIRPILMVDDDPEDCLLTHRALQRNNIPNPFFTVPNGEELLNYLHQRGTYAGPEAPPAPLLILLDLKMPKMDGWKALQEVKSDGRFRRTPIIIFSSSQVEDDILQSYESGANSYIAKTASFEKLMEVIDIFKGYWLETVKLPPA